MMSQIEDLADVAQIEAHFDDAFRKGQFRRALLAQMLLGRALVLRLYEAAASLSIPEGASAAKAEATAAQGSAMIDAADALVEALSQIEASLTARDVTDPVAKLALLCLDLGSARALAIFAESGLPGTLELEQVAHRIGGARSSATRRAKADALRAAYDALPSGLTVKEAAFALHQRFPERSVLGIEETVRRWRAN